MKNLAFVVAVLLCMLCAPAHGQQDFSSESKSWTFTMPAGWQPMSQEMVAKVNKEYKVRNPDHPAKVVAGFIKSGGLFVYPQIVLQVCETDMSKLSWPALERMYKEGDDETEGAESAATILDLVWSTGVEDDADMHLNEGARQITAKGTLVLDSGAELQTASRAFLHGAGVVQLSALEVKSNAGGAQRALDQFANSFRVASGHEFTPAPDNPPRRQRSVSYSPGMMRYGFFGGGIVGLGGLGFLIRVMIRAWANGD
jgi:hypothetical protein